LRKFKSENSHKNINMIL